VFGDLNIWQDIRYSARTLRASPVFAAAVLLAIALSIGPVTAILNIGNWLLWRPHPGVTDSRSLALVCGCAGVVDEEPAHLRGAGQERQEARC
jgi:hypothetical protein